MYKIKKFATVTLAVLIFTVIPVTAFAAECQETEASKHTHNFVRFSAPREYVSTGDTKHILITTSGYRCSGCKTTKDVKRIMEPQDHIMGASYYTGENYHSGSFHYARYKSSCIQCGHIKLEWKPYQCPGNGNCILPQSVTPVPVEK